MHVTHDDSVEGTVSAAVSWRIQLAYHFAVTFAADSFVCVGTLAMWSSIFYGAEMFAFLFDYHALSLYFLAACTFILLALYMLDFFWPPHYHELFVLWPGDRFLGRSFFGIALVLFVTACYLRTGSFVSLPLLISICVCPLAVYGVHLIYDPFKPRPVKRRRTEIVQTGGVEDKMNLLKAITGEETNEEMFYAACTMSFVAWFLINLIFFIAGTVLSGPSLVEMTRDLTLHERDAKYVQWAAPLIMAIANLVYGTFAGMRVIVQKAYSRTDTHKNRLIADLSESVMMKEMMEHKMAILSARSTTINDMETGHSLKKKQQQYLAQHTAMVNQLSTIIKGVICLFIVLLGLCYCARQMVYASTHIASMVAGTMAVFFLIFCLFAYVSLYRVVQAMGRWMLELPAWQNFVGLLDNPWVKATMVCTLVPLLPFAMFLSVFNQYIRRHRGIYNMTGELTRNDSGPLAHDAASDRPDEQKGVLTPRVAKKIRILRSFEWLEITPKIYTLCLCYFAYTIFPPPMNVALAGMNKAIAKASIPYPIILVLIFVTGIIAFLLPTVPGAVMYMFGGLISSAHCPAGFWPGAIIGIFLGLLMKLVGSAVQQIGIGGMMGRSLAVRQQVGVHKPFIRCIEHVLREKGFTAGKVAILCGGPDWPTSVLAGILGLPLLEMEIGTLPIVGFIAPFGLSGSLSLKAGQSKVMQNMAQLMLVSAMLVTLVLWALAGWACQQALEKHREELTRPLQQNVDLEWLDYRETYIKDQLHLKWEDLPRCVQISWALGALVHIFVCYSFCFGSSALVGEFQLDDDISTLSFANWTVEKSLFSYACLGVVTLYLVGWLGNFQYKSWLKSKTKEPLARLQREVDTKEAAWKENYIRKCEAHGKGSVLLSSEAQTKSSSVTVPEPTVSESSMRHYDSRFCEILNRTRSLNSDIRLPEWIEPSHSDGRTAAEAAQAGPAVQAPEVTQAVQVTQTFQSDVGIPEPLKLSDSVHSEHRVSDGVVLPEVLEHTERRVSGSLVVPSTLLSEHKVPPPLLLPDVGLQEVRLHDRRLPDTKPPEALVLPERRLPDVQLPEPLYLPRSGPPSAGLSGVKQPEAWLFKVPNPSDAKYCTARICALLSVDKEDWTPPPDPPAPTFAGIPPSGT